MKFLFASLKFTITEHTSNLKKIWDISLKTMKQQTLRTSLGLGWVVFRDLIYFTVFILFRLLMSGSGEVQGMHFILYLMLGMVPWNFISECINSAPMAIKKKKSMLTSIKFPMIILPTIEVVAIFLKRLFTLIILGVTINYFGDFGDITWWMFAYYFVSMFIAVAVWSLFFSALVTVSNDFEQLYKTLMSIMFYSLPIIWSFEKVSEYPMIEKIISLNPFVYILNGFRDAFVTGAVPTYDATLYFWAVILVTFWVGSILQYKLKKYYTDVI